MSFEPQSFDELMGQARSGSQQAAWELVESYGAHVLRVVRRHLNVAMRSKFDSTDFVQSVWASFFRNREQFDEIKTQGQLIGFLLAIARNKVHDEQRRRLDFQKYDLRKEELMTVAHSSGLADRLPRPSEIAIAKERWDQLITNQLPINRRVVELRLAGSTFDEIGRELGINERTARRVIDRLLEEHSDDGK